MGKQNDKYILELYIKYINNTIEKREIIKYLV